MRLIPDKIALTRQLLETGRTSFIRGAKLSLEICEVNLAGFKDPTVTAVELFGDDYRILAPDSGLSTSEYRHTNASVLNEAGLPVIAFVWQQNQAGEKELVAVNVHEPRQSVLVQGRVEKHILDNQDWIDGGLNLAVYWSSQTNSYQPKDLTVAKIHGEYILSIQGV